MKTYTIYINKLLGYLRKLCKPRGADLLLISKVLSVCLFMTFHMLSSAQTPRKDSGADEPMNHVLRGTVVSAVDNKPLDGVSVRVDSEKARTSTKKDGTFSLSVGSRKGLVKFTYVGYKSQEINYTSGVSLIVKLIPEDNVLDEVEVVSTGYQKIPKERATGSFEFVDNKLFNRKVSTDFVSRLEDVVPSISTTKMRTDSRGKLLNLNVRGQSSMRSNVWPLIVLDGMPYQGDFNNINPNDIENITVLKDAAASSIWGAQSGNGVIVITTKKAQFNSSARLSFNSNFTIVDKPDLFYQPAMTSKDYIEAERYLFDKGAYDYKLDDIFNRLSPVLLLLKNARNNEISSTQLELELDKLKEIDSRKDFSKYIYRKAVKQQYSAQLTAGSAKFSNLFSVGFDKNLNQVVTSSNERLNLRNYFQMKPLNNLSFGIDMRVTEVKNKEFGYSNLNQYQLMFGGNYPYARLADENGNPVEVIGNGPLPAYQDTAGNGRLLSWKYLPLAELDQSSQQINTKENIINFDSKWEIIKGLNLYGLFSYRKSNSVDETLLGAESYYMRQLINSYAVYDDQSIKWNIPNGDKMSIYNSENTAQQGRLQVNYDIKWKDRHELNAIAGYEMRQNISKSNSSIYFGYNKDRLMYSPVDYVSQLPLANGYLGTSRIFAEMPLSHINNRFVSYFTNASYSYDAKYILSASARKDASNLFGVKSNNRGKPFWSVGASWVISNESFIKDYDGIAYLKLRATYGHNGNINNNTAAYPIMSLQNQVHPITNLPYARIQSPPNPTLRWETVGMLNFGLDFATKDHRISGSIEYYRKTPRDLISSTRIDPTSGFTSLSVNSANLLGTGVDLSLQSKNVISRNFAWLSNVVFSYNRTKVTKSYLSNTRANNYIAGAGSIIQSPVEGGDLFGQYAFKWAGLDPETGKPQGYVDGAVSKDYAAIYNGTQIADADNMGSLVPLYFGALRNTFTFKNWEASFNISFQLGHVFMRHSFNDYMFWEYETGHKDYARRWQKPGDEKWTDVPAFNYPVDYNASMFYNYSSALVEKADQIKLRDFQLSYRFTSSKLIKNPQVYCYAQNLGTIWRANKFGIDPEYGISSPDALAVSLGLKFSL